MIYVSLHLDEAETILRALNYMDNVAEELLEDFEARIAEEKEIQNLDFDDCAGGACKL